MRPYPRKLGRTAVAFALGFSFACSDDAGPIEAPQLTSPITVVPSEGLPAGVTVQDANNNLDIVRHDGRVFFAFRTAPSHFASEETVLYVVSSADQQTWALETTIAVGKDVREPRFLSLDGELHLYFAILGSNPLDFEPGQMQRTTRDTSGIWSAPESTYVAGFIPWRAKVVGGTAYLIGYTGGENIYDLETRTPLQIHLLTTTDGRAFSPAVGDSPVVLEGGGSEADFVVLDDGTLVAVVRNEAGDEEGWGSKICRAEAGDFGNWTCKTDPKKYDSPLLFKVGNEVVLVGRKTLENAGRYDLGREGLDHQEATQLYLFTYSEGPKRCAVWRVNDTDLTVDHLVDLPSKGDTCFASVLADGERSFTLYNYTSPIDGPDVSWLIGQLGTTSIYRVGLTF